MPRLNGSPGFQSHIYTYTSSYIRIYIFSSGIKAPNQRRKKKSHKCIHDISVIASRLSDEQYRTRPNNKVIYLYLNPLIHLSIQAIHSVHSVALFNVYICMYIFKYYSWLIMTRPFSIIYLFVRCLFFAVFLFIVVFLVQPATLGIIELYSRHDFRLI